MNSLGYVIAASITVAINLIIVLCAVSYILRHDSIIDPYILTGVALGEIFIVQLIKLIRVVINSNMKSH